MKFGRRRFLGKTHIRWWVCIPQTLARRARLSNIHQHSGNILPNISPTSRHHMAESGLRGPCAVKAKGCSGREASRNSDHDWNWRGTKIAGSLKSSDRDFDGVETVWTPKERKQPGSDICKNGACIRLGCGAPVKAAAKAAASTEPLPHEPPVSEMPAFNGVDVMLAAVQVAAARAELASIDALVEHLNARRNVLGQIIGATGAGGGASGGGTSTSSEGARPEDVRAPAAAAESGGTCGGGGSSTTAGASPAEAGCGSCSGGAARHSDIAASGRWQHGRPGSGSGSSSGRLLCPGCAQAILDPLPNQGTCDEHGAITWYCSVWCRDHPEAPVRTGGGSSGVSSGGAAAAQVPAAASHTRRGSGGHDSDGGLFGSSPEASPARPAAAAPSRSALGKRKAGGQQRGGGAASGRSGGGGRAGARSGPAHGRGDSSWMAGTNDVSSAEEGELIGDGVHNTRILRR